LKTQESLTIEKGKGLPLIHADDTDRKKTAWAPTSHEIGKDKT